VPVPVFCCFCILENLYKKYSQNWTKQMLNLLFFPTQRRSPKQIRRRTRWQPHHRVVCPPGHATVWCAPWVPSEIAIPPINSLWCKNPRGIDIHPRKVLQHRCHRRPILGDRSLYSGTLSGWGIALGAISINSTAIFIVVVVSHDEEGVVLPRGWGLYQ
jgi:hypothetical protein